MAIIKNDIQEFELSPIVPPATQADHVPQFGQVIGSNATGTVLTLSNGGTNYNYATPSAATSYTLAAGFTTNDFARCFINAPTEPMVTGAAKVGGVAFIPDVVMEMVVESPDGAAVEFYFVER